MLLADALTYVLPEVVGCPDIAAIPALRLAAIDFCQRSLVWKDTTPAISTVIGQAAYAYAPAAGTVVARLDSLTLDGEDVDVLSPGDGQAKIARKSTDTFAFGKLGGLVLMPAPAAAGLQIVPFCSLAPSATAESIPDELAARYIEKIAKGAIWRLKNTSNKTYTDKAGALDALGVFEAGINDARSDASTGGASVVMRTASVWL